MNPGELRNLIESGEGTTLEFKEALPSSLAREMVAFANTAGGRLLLGVRDDGAVVGIEDTNTLRARILDTARNCDPPVKVMVEPVGEVVVVHVEESDSKPVLCSEGFFWRRGAVTQKLSRAEIRDFFRVEGTVQFDRALCPRFRYPQDFDRAKYHAWLKLSGISGRPRTEDVLLNIGAAERVDRKLTFRNAGVLFFAKHVRQFFNHAYITCLLATGADKVHVLDRKDFEGGCIADIEETMRFIERNTRSSWRIEALQRENIPEYPMKALREAITNAVMHRNWFIEGANVFVEIYTDRIEVVSPGGLPKGMTLADLGRKSVRRNALIADLLHRVNFIEKAGTGVRRIREEARAGGYPEPTWEVNGFTTTIFRPNPEVRAMVASLEERERDHDGEKKGPCAVQKGTMLGNRNDGLGAKLEQSMDPRGTMTDQKRDHVGGKKGPSRDHVAVLRKCRVEQPLAVLLRVTGRTSRTKFASLILTPLLARGLLQLTIPDKPRSRKQRYITTAAGRAWLSMVR